MSLRSRFPRLLRAAAAGLHSSKSRATCQFRDFTATAARSDDGKPSFDWQDPLWFKSLLTDEEVAISDTAERFCQEHLQSRIQDAYRNEHFDKSILTEMGSLGLLGATIKGHSCAGVSTVAGGMITRAVERVDSGYRSAMSVQSSLVMGGIDAFGSAEQKERFLPPMARGELIGAFGLTEPNHGSDPGGMEAVARPHPTEPGAFSLFGSKTWITNSPVADVLLVWARDESTNANTSTLGKIRGFLVERNRCPAGTLSTPAIKNKTGLRASITGMIHMDGCPVARQNVLPSTTGAVGLRGPFACLNSARLGIAFGVMGALEDCITRAQAYALERQQFGGPLARFQLVQAKLADAVTDAGYGMLAAVQVARLKDGTVGGGGGSGTSREVHDMISLVKRRNCDSALRGARALQEVLGGNAVADEFVLGRHVANLFVTQTYEGQSDIHALILGRAITGIQAFS